MNITITLLPFQVNDKYVNIFSKVKIHISHACSFKTVVYM